MTTFPLLSFLGKAIYRFWGYSWNHVWLLLPVIWHPEWLCFVSVSHHDHLALGSLGFLDQRSVSMSHIRSLAKRVRIIRLESPNLWLWPVGVVYKRRLEGAIELFKDSNRVEIGLKSRTVGEIRCLKVNPNQSQGAQGNQWTHVVHNLICELGLLIATWYWGLNIWWTKKEINSLEGLGGVLDMTVWQRLL